MEAADLKDLSCAALMIIMSVILIQRNRNRR